MMHLPSFFAIHGVLGMSAFDDMLRLIGVAAIIHVTFKGIRSLMHQPSAAAPETESSPAPVQPIVAAAPAASVVSHSHEETISPEIVAVIAAAISSFTDSPHRIVSIRHQSSSWELAGRQSVLTSHKIR
jgi:hypothetical protein